MHDNTYRALLVLIVCTAITVQQFAGDARHTSTVDDVTEVCFNTCRWLDFEVSAVVDGPRCDCWDSTGDAGEALNAN